MQNVFFEHIDYDSLIERLLILKLERYGSDVPIMLEFFLIRANLKRYGTHLLILPDEGFLMTMQSDVCL